MPRKTRATIGFFIAATACSTPPQEIPQDLPPVVTRFAYADGSARYVYSAQRTTEQEVAGQTTRAETQLRVHLSTAVTASSAERRVTFVVDSIVTANGSGFTQSARRAVTGLTVEGIFDETGEIRDIEYEGERSTLMASVTSTIASFYPRIPTEGVLPRAEWVDTTMINIDDGSTRITKRSIVYSTAGDWDSGGDMISIDWRAEYVIEGEGQQMGQGFTLAGGGVTEGQHTLSAEGFYVATGARDSSSAEVTLPTIGISVPVLQVGIDSVSIVR